MFRKVLVFLVLVSSLLLTTAGYAQMVPAQFGSSKEEFIARLGLPELAPGVEILVRCGADVQRNGALENIACFENVEHAVEAQQLVREIVRVAQFVRVSAALVDNKETLVWMNFAVRIRQSDAGAEVEIFEHHLMNVDKLGMNYVSAQRFDKGGWGCFNTSKSVELLQARVDAAGRVHDLQVSTIRIDERCADRIAAAARDSRYIPAMVDGEPVESLYYEMFFWR